MRKWLSAVAVVATLGYTGTALADTPAQVYSDFAADGTLSCGHSRGALEGVLKDASLHQYGDPYTLLGLKLAVRKQLAGGCRRTPQAAATSASGGGYAAQEPDPQAPAGGSTPASEQPPATAETDQSDESSAVDGKALGKAESSRDGRILLVGVLLLLLALASGGWAAKRAYTDRG